MCRHCCVKTCVCVCVQLQEEHAVMADQLSNELSQREDEAALAETR